MQNESVVSGHTLTGYSSLVSKTSERFAQNKWMTILLWVRCRRNAYLNFSAFVLKELLISWSTMLTWLLVVTSISAFKIYRYGVFLQVTRMRCPGYVIKLTELAVTIVIQTTALWFVRLAFLITLMGVLHWEAQVRMPDESQTRSWFDVTLSEHLWAGYYGNNGGNWKHVYWIKKQEKTKKQE